MFDGGAGHASMISIGGVRMGDSRTGKFARELFCRDFSWASGSFEVGELKRLKSFQVTSSKGRSSSGSVTSPLFGATLVDLEPEESNNFKLIIGCGEDVERFCSNNSIFVIKGSIIGDKIEADVTKWLPKQVVYSEFKIPDSYSDGSEYVQKGDVPSARSGSKFGILSKSLYDATSGSATILCTGGVCNPSPGSTKYLPEDSNIFLLQYPSMIWKKLPSEDLLRRSHHAMHIFGQTAFVVGGYSWSEGKAKKLFPVNEFTRILFSDDFEVQMIDVIEVSVPPSCTASLFLSGFSLAGVGNKLFVFGGIPFPKYEHDKENFHTFLPPETSRNKLPEATSNLLKINLGDKDLTVVCGPKDAASHNSSMQILNPAEPLLVMVCDPKLYIYRP